MHERFDLECNSRPAEGNAEYLGKNFAKEAREICNEEKPARGIFGGATMDEAKSLIKEGVNVMPLPSLPEDEN